MRMYLVVHDSPQTHDADVDVVLGVAHLELGHVSRASPHVGTAQSLEGWSAVTGL